MRLERYTIGPPRRELAWCLGSLQQSRHLPTGRFEIGRTTDYQQVGERQRSFETWERDDLIRNLVSALKQCNPDIQERMVGHFRQCDEDYGRQVADGLGIKFGRSASARR